MVKRNGERHDENTFHNLDKRTRSTGGTTTSTTGSSAASATLNHQHHHRSLSSMDERKNGETNDVSRSDGQPPTAVVPQHPHPYHHPNDDHAPHHHVHPYYHHHQDQHQEAYYHAQLYQQHSYPAQVPPEEETTSSIDHRHPAPPPQFFVPAASIRDDDDHDDIVDKNICNDPNPKSRTISDTVKSNSISNSNNSQDNEITYKNRNSDGLDEIDMKRKDDIDTTSKDINEEKTDIDPDKYLDPNNIDRATSQDYYFDSYAHHAIHEEMLKDEVRTKTYEMAICQNKHLFQDKIVLDVGCGTGILSMFAARAGAKHIYAVDCSSIIVQAQKIVDINGLSDKITLIRGKVEDINLPVDTVDIIISEWMGYFLLYESMLDTVLYARDKWLVKTDGIIFPDKAVMYITAIEDGSVRRDRFDYWDDVYGFDMSPIKEIALREPVVDVVDAKALVTDGVPILSLDILTCTKEDLDFTSHFKLQALRNDYIHGLVAYFECAFTQIHKPIGFSTSPMARYTHWKQTILYLPEPLTVCAGEVVMGEISCQPNQRNRRDLDIGLTLTFKGRYSECENKKIPYRLR